jgi:hypothetical protein
VINGNFSGELQQIEKNNKYFEKKNGVKIIIKQ